MVNVIEVVILTSLAWASVVIGVITLRIRFGNKHNKNAELSLSKATKAKVNMESRDSLLATTNIVSMDDYLARKKVKEAQLTPKLHGKETKIIYPLKKL